MIDAREQLRAELLAICPNVKLSKPEGDVSLPLIVYTETLNVPAPIGIIPADKLGFRVTVYHSTFKQLVELTNAADELISKLGYTRTGKSGDDKAFIGTDLYGCSLDYIARVDTRYNAIIKNMI